VKTWVARAALAVMIGAVLTMHGADATSAAAHGPLAAMSWDRASTVEFEGHAAHGATPSQTASGRAEAAEASTIGTGGGADHTRHGPDRSGNGHGAGHLAAACMLALVTAMVVTRTALITRLCRRVVVAAYAAALATLHVVDAAVRPPPPPWVRLCVIQR
jgi:hypothetical protein